MVVKALRFPRQQGVLQINQYILEANQDYVLYNILIIFYNVVVLVILLFFFKFIIQNFFFKLFALNILLIYSLGSKTLLMLPFANPDGYDLTWSQFVDPHCMVLCLQHSF